MGATVSKTTAIVLVLALGFHAVFEGIAFGLMTDLSQAGQLALGIIAHKPAAAVSLGAAFARTGYTMGEILLFVGLFSVSTPIGVVIGMLAAETNLLIDTIFVCLSGGTFIYIACSEMIVAEFDRGKYQCWKMVLVILGALTITAVWFFGGEHDHGHGDHGGHGHAHL